MTHPIISQLVAADRQRQLAADAARYRLAAIASCCRPSRIAAVARALRARLTAPRRPTACCA